MRKHTSAGTVACTFHLFESHKLDEMDSTPHLIRQFCFSAFLNTTWELHGRFFSIAEVILAKTLLLLEKTKFFLVLV